MNSREGWTADTGALSAEDLTVCPHPAGTIAELLHHATSEYLRSIELSSRPKRSILTLRGTFRYSRAGLLRRNPVCEGSCTGLPQESADFGRSSGRGSDAEDVGGGQLQDTPETSTLSAAERLTGCSWCDGLGMGFNVSAGYDGCCNGAVPLECPETRQRLPADGLTGGSTQHHVFKGAVASVEL